MALNAAGVDVVLRSSTMFPQHMKPVSPMIEEMEHKSLTGVDTVIQLCLPHTFCRTGGVRNIGEFIWETSRFYRPDWTKHCSMMDKIWTTCLQSRKAITGSKLPSMSVSAFPISTDMAQFDEPYETLDFGKHSKRCLFYFAGEFVNRKNFDGMLRAYYNAFTNRDRVALVIKTAFPGKSGDDERTQISSEIGRIKESMRRFGNPAKYPPVLLFTGTWSNTDIHRLHKTCSVFVSLSHGEGWCIPCHDALCHGKPVIASNWGAFPELTYPQADKYWDETTGTFRHPGEIGAGWLIDGSLDYCAGPSERFPDLYTGTERWFMPSLPQAAQAMQQAYAEWADGTLEARSPQAKAAGRRFTNEFVGKMLKEALSK
jgi:glycosyltransferase involved in cell wall biosynthesis